ncbi:MAG: hypothetical protein GX962_03960 [Epulopiscium sp.]|nr:hypothetical protein [Candidatus Epulonipiscium sp.]
MRQYKIISVQKEEVASIHCNGCGTPIPRDKHGNFEETLHIEKEWGYLSKRDGEIHSIDLCQNCYEKWINTFAISPVSAYKNKE